MCVCVHVNVRAQTPLHACARFPVCLWDSSLPASSSKCVCPNAATPGQEVLSCFICHDKKLCAVERKELAVTWISFVLFFPLLFLLTLPSTHPTHPCQLLSYPKRVVLARRFLDLGLAGKGPEAWKSQADPPLLAPREGDQQACPSVTRSKISAEIFFHCVRPPSATAIPAGARSRARAVVAVPSCLSPAVGSLVNSSIRRRAGSLGLPGDILSLTPLSHPPGCHDKAVLLYEYVGKRIVDLQHTEVPDAYRGRGIAKHLAKVQPPPPLLPWAEAVAVPAVARDPG